jgi:hypothetical protein
LTRLLGAQSGPVRRHPGFSALERLLRESPRLRDVRLPSVAYRLLDEPRLDVRNVPDFCATYRVPESAFVSGFLRIKWERRAELAAGRSRREAEIGSIAEGYPSEVLTLMRYLEEVERDRNADRPLWKKRLFPSTKRRALRMAAFSRAEWLGCLVDCIGLLRAGYRRIALPPTEALVACMILECLPDPATGNLPSPATVRSSYRRLCKLHHPDSGGAEERFLLLKEARDSLLD